VSIATLSGRMLVATPLLGDPSFARTVVLMLEHQEEGALGVVLNRPSGLPVADILPMWADVVQPPAMVFHGGPVSTDSALGLVRLIPDTTPLGVRPLRGRLGLVDLDTPVEIASPGVEAMRVFAGYAGWGAGQLEGELDEEAWFVVDALPEDPFVPEPDQLWRDVLRRQPHPLSLVASFPTDPALN
jgi:putative transcriptional regulator